MTLQRRSAAVPLLVVALSACGGGGATAQVPVPPDDGLAHAYLYHVAPEHVAALQARGTQEAPAFVEVTGTATVSVRPDRVRASFAVETRADEADEASARNAELMDAVVRALRGSGVAGLEVETSGYSLRPEYSWSEPSRTRVIDGYTAVNHVVASAGDVAAAGRLVDLAIRAGANRVAALAFEASDTEAAGREALAAAVRSATEQARTMAAALGRTLGAPLEVRGGAQHPLPRGGPEVALMRAAEAVDTPIEAGDVTVSASVTIRFALGGPVEAR